MGLSLVTAPARSPGKYRISQYGDSVGLPVFKTDFGTIGIILCGDIYSQEISRASRRPGSGVHLLPVPVVGSFGNIEPLDAASPGHRQRRLHGCRPLADVRRRPAELRHRPVRPESFAASSYWSDSVCTADVDLAAGRPWFTRSNNPGPAGQKGYLAAYYPKTIPEKRTDLLRRAVGRATPRIVPADRRQDPGAPPPCQRGFRQDGFAPVAAVRRQCPPRVLRRHQRPGMISPPSSRPTTTGPGGVGPTAIISRHGAKHRRCTGARRIT